MLNGKTSPFVSHKSIDCERLRSLSVTARRLNDLEEQAKVSRRFIGNSCKNRRNMLEYIKHCFFEIIRKKFWKKFKKTLAIFRFYSYKETKT